MAAVGEQMKHVVMAEVLGVRVTTYPGIGNVGGAVHR